jgi:uncharacterized protein YrrD
VLIKSKELQRYKLGAKDGDTGKVRDFYFDDRHWAIRYLVADTGGWLMGRKVLIAPYGIEYVSTDNRVIKLNLTRKQIESSPSLESDQPVSQQFEESYYGYYGWPIYWTGLYAWGVTPNMDRSEFDESLANERKRHWDPSLRSTNEVAGYNVQACDGELGHIRDFIVDDQTWEIRYLVIDTGNWFGGKQVLVSPHWIESVSWSQSLVYTSLTQNEIQAAPEYSEQALLDRTYEASLYDHYGRDKYWDTAVDLNRISSTRSKINKSEPRHQT